TLNGTNIEAHNRVSGGAQTITIQNNGPVNLADLGTVAGADNGPAGTAVTAASLSAIDIWAGDNGAIANDLTVSGTVIVEGAGRLASILLRAEDSINIGASIDATDIRL